MRMVLLAASLLVSSFASYATETVNSTVDSITQWEGSDKIVITLSTGTNCFISTEEKALYSLFLNLFSSGKSANFTCKDNEKNINELTAHRLIKVVATR